MVLYPKLSVDSTCIKFRSPDSANQVVVASADEKGAATKGLAECFDSLAARVGVQVALETILRLLAGDPGNSSEG